MAKKREKEKVIRFVFNDENVENSHGFYIRTSGIKLDRFEDNPVMLSDHSEWLYSVIGNWVGVTASKGVLTGTPVFDVEDDHANHIGGKVERGFVRGCSMGIIFDPDDLINDGDKIILTKCELVECSIVAVPSNKKSVRLYKKEGVKFEDSEIKNLCLSIKNETPNEEQIDMKKIILSVPTLMALGIMNATNEGVDQTELETKILALNTENTSLKTANAAMKTALEAEQLSKATTLVDEALKVGKITADQKQTYIDLAKANFTLAKETIDVLPSKTSLSGTTTPPTGSEVKTMEDFQKLSVTEQLAIKNDTPEVYQQILKTI